MDQIEETLDKGIIEMEPRHKVQAILTRCGDGRINEATFKFMQEEAGMAEYDLGATPPGGAWVFSNDAPKEAKEVYFNDQSTYDGLHEPEEWVLTVHEDCGKLKGVYGFDPSTEDGKKKQEEVFDKVTSEAYRFIADKGYTPKVYRYNETRLNPKTQKMDFEIVDITEKVKRIVEVGEE